MIWIEKVIRTISPHVDLEGSPWIDEWENAQRRVFVRTARGFFPLIALGYVFHFYLFDVPNGLSPVEGWAAYRFTGAVLFAVSAAYYFTDISGAKWYKAPAIAATFFLCVSQAFVTYFYPAAPWLYPYVFVLVSVILLRLNAAQSVVFAAACMATFVPVLVRGGIDLATLLSATTIVLVIVAAVRSSYAFEVSNFLLNKQNAAQQQQNLELQQEFSDRIQSFIPSVIARRIREHVATQKSSVLEASLSVLRAEQKLVACLFSDIRGFTQGSKNLTNFVRESVMPEVKAVSEEIDKLEGIPRKIGDLIFAYYDHPSLCENIVRALLSAIQLARRNRDMNETVATIQIKRYILVSSGEAIVGNLGGLDSSVEITALGSPVNFLSRLDDTTKDPKLADLLAPGDIIVSESSFECLATHGVNIDVKRIDLKKIGVSVRDFPETERIYVLRDSASNEAALRGALHSENRDGTRPEAA